MAQPIPSLSIRPCAGHQVRKSGLPEFHVEYWGFEGSRLSAWPGVGLQFQGCLSQTRQWEVLSQMALMGSQHGGSPAN